MATEIKKWKGYLGFAVIVCLFIVVILLCSPQEHIFVHPCVKSLLAEQKITDCYITDLGDYSGISCYITTPVVNAQEKESFIDEIKNEYGITEITESFVKEKYACDSVGDFYNLIDKKLEQRSLIRDILECRRRVMDELIEVSSFRLNTDEVAQYALRFLNEYEELAFLYNMDINDYCTEILKIDPDQLFDRCYKEGEKEIKAQLIIGAIANKEWGNITQEGGDNDLSDIDSYQEIENRVYDLFVLNVGSTKVFKEGRK